MNFKMKDNIRRDGKNVYHESAGGFIFHEDLISHKLYVALIRPENDTRWFIPKGHLSGNETPREAAEREIREELSLRTSLTFVSGLGVDQYSFTLDDSGDTHYKKVYLFVYTCDEKEGLTPLVQEKISEASWIEFYEAVDMVAYDRNNLLRARQLYYFNKKVTDLKSTDDVRSISIGIPTHNGSHTIKETMVSIVDALSHISKDISLEFIVCTDHCTDNTKAVVEQFFTENNNNHTRYLLLENDGKQGKAPVMNKIFENMKSNIVCFIDDDVALSKECLQELIMGLTEDSHLRCVYAWWVRKKYLGRNLWKRFWHWILGVKFDILLFKRRSEYMRGGCVMFRRENYVHLSENIINEDQFLQYIYWPMTKEVESAKIYFNSVTSITDYYRRFIRIIGGSKQLNAEFAPDRIQKCHDDLHQKICFKSVLKSPWRLTLSFLLYRIIRFFVASLVYLRLKLNKEYEWHRINQN
jgi:glycosyltransferase involved in cell wall biosynthesis/8-oxo-dGTP pyrophosphatase MutT (NUDIX family)